MNFFIAILQNECLISAFAAWFLAQSIKVVTDIIQNRRFDMRWFLLSGGFPSSHSSSVSALATSIGLINGISSAAFAIATIFALIVMADAQGVRQSAGKQAEVLNRIIVDFYTKKGLKFDQLKEFLGHTPFEVFAGMLLGIAVAIVFHVFIY